MDSMKLGLPPQSLMPAYFEYNKLVSQTSGSSTEAKLFRLEHPEWNQWEIENLGWKANAITYRAEYYRLKVKWKDFSGVDSAEYAADKRRMEAYEKKVPSRYIGEYVEYFTVASAERDEWLMAHPEYYREVYLGVLGHEEVGGGGIASDSGKSR
jgi:hypothetical protein